MVSMELKYLIRDDDRHGNVRYYVRRPGVPKIRIRSQVGTRQFLDEYHKALSEGQSESEEARNFQATSLGFLCNVYLASHELQSLAVSTQSWRRRELLAVCEKYGPLPFKGVEAADVRMLVREKAATPGAARNRLKALKALMKWGCENDYLKRDPSIGVTFKMPPSDGFPTWTEADIEKYKSVHHAGSKARLSMMLLLHTACRRSDVVRLGWGNVKDGWIKFRPQKNSTQRSYEQELPITQELKEELDRANKNQLLFLQTEWGKGFTVNGFGIRFRNWCNEAGLRHLSAHGLRKATAVRLADSGANGLEISAVLGQASVQQAEPYLRKANRRNLAAQGMRKIKQGTKQSPTRT